MAQQLPQQRSHHPADIAQAMLNLVFMQTGRFFVDPALRDSNRAHSGVKMVFPTALNNYHQALDEMEVKIARAQQTMRRDLALLRTAREQKEAEAAEKEKVDAQVPAVQENTISKTAPEVVEQEVNPNAADVEMQDPIVAKPEATTPSITQDEVKQPSPAVTQPTQPTQSAQPAKPPPIQTQSKEKDEKSADAEAAPLTATGTDDLFGRTPTTAGVNQFDLDSMFDGSADVQPNNADDMDFGLDDNATGGSLLPGIEDFANTSSDINMIENNTIDDLMLDLPSELDSTVPTSGDATTSQAISQPPQTQGETSTTDFASSNFDDLFGQDYDLDLEDGLLAPENTAFDDAWGFGDDD